MVVLSLWFHFYSRFCHVKPSLNSRYVFLLQANVIAAAAKSGEYYDLELKNCAFIVTEGQLYSLVRQQYYPGSRVIAQRVVFNLYLMMINACQV